MRAALHVGLLAFHVSLCLAAGAGGSGGGGSLLDELRQIVASILGKATTWSPGNHNPVCVAIDMGVPGGIVSYPASLRYSSSLSSYYSQQNSQLLPGCFVRPRNAQDVAKTVKILSGAYRFNHSNQFAFKSGGHTQWSGAANIAGGVTIDLGSLNSVEVCRDRKTAQIQPGATWGDVYQALEPYRLAVSGGRVAQVGVGGLSLGGGISFFSPRYGFACDTIDEYEVVIANGSIVIANRQQNRDLWLALKGGSNNFGIVTKFTYATFPQGKLWGGQIFASGDTAPLQLRALAKFAGPAYDESTSVIQSYAYATLGGAAIDIVSNNVQSTTGTPNPPALKPLTGIPALTSTVRTDSLYSMAIELGAVNPNGKRVFEMTLTYENDLNMHNTSYSLFDATKDKVKGVANLTWLLIFEPLPTQITSRSTARGGNVLGLQNNNKSLMLVLLQAIWSEPGDDALLIDTMKGLYRDINQAARAAGKSHPYEYLNYADFPSQDPLTSYGAKNVAFMRDVARRYDREGFFQTASPGGFKLFA